MSLAVGVLIRQKWDGEGSADAHTLVYVAYSISCIHASRALQLQRAYSAQDGTFRFRTAIAVIERSFWDLVARNSRHLRR